MIYLNYVDDGILLSCHGTKLDAMIADLETELELTREGDLSAFLGIQIQKCPDSGSLHLTQEGLIKRILDATKLEGCNPSKTPANKDTWY